MNNLKYSIRRLSKTPGFVAVAILTFAIAIGANTTMFSIVNTLLLRPPQIRNPKQVVFCNQLNKSSNRSWSSFSYSQYRKIRESKKGFRDLAAQHYSLCLLEEGHTSKQIMGFFVSANYFTMLDVSPVLGRGFLPEEEHPGSIPVAVLSYSCWKRLGSDDGIVGQQIIINKQPVEVVGVAPKGFVGTSVLGGPHLWISLGSYTTLTLEENKEGAPYPSLMLIGRLPSGISIAMAERELGALALGFRELYPNGWYEEHTFELAYPSKFNLAGSEDSDEKLILSYVSIFVMSLSMIVLLIACSNLAHMYAVHSVSRHREISIRMALGSSRGRIIRQLLTESMTLTFLGGMCGFVLARWGISAVNHSINLLKTPMTSPDAMEGMLDGRCLIATLVFCTLATILSGLKPALRLTQRSMANDLRLAGRADSSVKRRKARHFQTTGQIALSVVLILLAVLFSRSLLRSIQTVPGYGDATKLLIELNTHLAGPDESKVRQTCENILDRLKTIPKVEYVSLTDDIPCDLNSTGYSVEESVPNRNHPENNTEQASFKNSRTGARSSQVSEDYFFTMDLALLRGRTFNCLDHTPKASRVVIINEALANRLRTDGNALDCMIRLNGSTYVWEVIGVVQSHRDEILHKTMQPHIYFPFDQDPSDFQTCFLLIKTTETNPLVQETLLKEARKRIHEINPRIPILSCSSLEDYYQNTAGLWFAKIIAKLTSGVAILALFLAALGIYGAKAYQTAIRTPEIGMRLAIGATQINVLSMILREGIILTLAGVSVGLVFALVIAQILKNMLCGIKPFDPISVLMTILILGSASLLACYLPARRAAKTDPMEALRYE